MTQTPSILPAPNNNNSPLSRSLIFKTVADEATVSAAVSDPNGLSIGLTQAQGTSSIAVKSTKKAEFTLFGFSKSEIYKVMNKGESISGNIAFVASVATLVSVPWNVE